MRANLRQIHIYQYTLQGILMGAIPLALLCTNTNDPQLAGLPLPAGALSITAAAGATLLMLGGITLTFRHKPIGRILALLGIALNMFTLFTEIISNSLYALLYSLFVIGASYYLITGKIIRSKAADVELQLSKIAGCSASLMLMTLLSPFFVYDFKFFGLSCLVSLLILWAMFIKFIHLKDFPQKKYLRWKMTILSLIPLALIAATQSVILPAFIISIFAFYASLRFKNAHLTYVELTLQHPARCLLLTFLLLALAGTLLLRTPPAMTGELSIIDAAFTSVSACCVTGLSVINIASELTLIGRFILLLLIQLGGLGIMTLTALALHALGRLTLNQEQLLAELTTSREQDIFQNLRLITFFTFTVEALFALLLTWGFYAAGSSFANALELGIFTSISAFCNAGFFPGAASLEPFASESLLLIIVAVEIIIGGLAPAISYSVLQKRSWQRLPFINKLILTVTALLLASCTAGMLLFEWNGIFSHLSIPDKLVNAFFHSATLRTAGFNTVSLNDMTFPAYLLMLLQMFIGGSPGSTAGGIKTTTLAVLILTFAAAVRREEHISVGFHRIPSGNIIQAVAVCMAAVFILLLTILMLAVTQNIPLKSIVFESVSALGTVGLSIGATAKLDEIGKLIVMAAMFIGRVGPLTLFLLLSSRRSRKTPDYPSINVPLG